MGTVVVDSSVVIGFTWPGDAHHDAAVAGIRTVRSRGDALVLPATVLSESLVGPHRSGTASDVHSRLVGFFGQPRVVDEDVSDVAASLRATYRALRLPDALVIATGIVDDAAVLTCDRRLGGVDARIQVLEP